MTTRPTEAAPVPIADWAFAIRKSRARGSPRRTARTLLKGPHTPALRSGRGDRKSADPRATSAYLAAVRHGGSPRVRLDTRSLLSREWPSRSYARASLG